MPMSYFKKETYIQWQRKAKTMKWFTTNEFHIQKSSVMRTTVTTFFAFRSGDFHSPFHNITSLTPVSLSWYADVFKYISKHK